MSEIYPGTPMGEPVTASRPATPAMTPGQAAYEAWAIPAECTWEDLEAIDRELWDDIAGAANRTGLAGVLAEAARYKAERDREAAERDKLDAVDTLLTATLTRLGNSHADMRKERDQLQAAHGAVAGKNAELAAELAEVRAELAEAIAAAIDTADRDEYQLVIREMLAYLAPGRTTTAGFQGMLDDWRKRAGLDGQP